MPISDPGNAGTASHDDWPAPRLVEQDDQSPARAEKGRRFLTAVLAVSTSAAVFIGGLGVIFTGEWRWLAIAAVSWTAGTILGAGLSVALYGSNPKRDKK
jgi:hypothetical protein